MRKYKKIDENKLITFLVFGVGIICLATITFHLTNRCIEGYIEAKYRGQEIMTVEKMGGGGMTKPKAKMSFGIFPEFISNGLSKITHEIKDVF